MSTIEEAVALILRLSRENTTLSTEVAALKGWQEDASAKLAMRDMEIERLRTAIERSARQMDAHGVRESQVLREALKVQ